MWLSWDLRKVGEISDEFTCICDFRHLEQDLEIVLMNRITPVAEFHRKFGEKKEKSMRDPSPYWQEGLTLKCSLRIQNMGVI